jgi:outer membrane lipoprotein SlyB
MVTAAAAAMAGTPPLRPATAPTAASSPASIPWLPIAALRRARAQSCSKGNKNVAAVAGAAGGALAGNAIQNRATSDTYDVTVRMDDGRSIVVNQRDLAGVRENTYVRIVNGKAVIR